MVEETGVHVPVLLKEVLETLRVTSGERYLDATVGRGGHSAAILAAGGVVLGIDTDPEAVAFVTQRFAAEITTGRFQAAVANFREIAKVAQARQFTGLSGILFDLGLSSWQLEASGRGFSFLKDEPLDMRLDPTLGVTAADLLNGLAEREIDALLSRFAEEKSARAIARACVSARRIRPLRSSQDLAGLLAWVELRSRQDFWTFQTSTFLKDPARFGSYDRRARVFQALRMVVNSELDSLKEALPQALRLLRLGGRLTVLSFHSLEDRVVKDFGREFSEVVRGPNEVAVRILTRKPQVASPAESEINPRSRSAKLRGFELVRL